MVGICEVCGREAKIDIHHKDKDHTNNCPDNIMRVCRWCHRVLDGKHSRLKLPFPEVKRQYQAFFPRV